MRERETEGEKEREQERGTERERESKREIEREAERERERSGKNLLVLVQREGRENLNQYFPLAMLMDQQWPALNEVQRIVCSGVQSN